MAGKARVELASSNYGNLLRRQTRYIPKMEPATIIAIVSIVYHTIILLLNYTGVKIGASVG